MAEGLVIQVGADVQQANKGLAQINGSISILEKQFERLQKLASMPGLSFRQQERLNNLLLSTQNELNKTKRAFDNVNPAMQKFQRTTSSATAASINFGRVIQDAPYGFIGIANNLNPLLESFQRLKAESGSTGGAMKALGKSLMGAGGVGIALSLVTTAVTFATTGFGMWTRGLGGAKSASDAAAESTKKYSDELERIKGRIDGLVSSIEFANQLGSLNVKIFGFGNLQDLREQSVAQSNLLGSIQQELAELTTQRLELQKKQLKAIGDGEDKEAEELEKQIEGNIKTRSELWKKEIDAQNTLRLLYRRIALQKLEDQKEADEKAKQEYEKYVNDIISRGKELADFFRGRRVVPDFTIFDTKDEQFKKAQTVIREFLEGSMKLIFRPQVEVEPVLIRTPKTVSAFQTELRKLVADLQKFRTTDIPEIKVSLRVNINPEIIKQNDEIRKNLLEMASLGKFVGEKLADGFNGVFDAISNGESVIKAFGNAIKQVVQDLIQAAIRAFIVRSITNLFAPGLGGIGKVGSLFGSIPGFASGAIVSGPTLAMVGEGAGTSRSNPEIIAPLNQLQAILADSWGGGNQVVIIHERTRGRDIRRVQSRETRSQRRTTGR
jgi:hypothetical protein